ncbi:MAG: hypothetical protein A2600_07510 [Candidatus Lambdaproteobacteria bacterium RIFOXYD1_FULL_56_27]|uniref:Uncharacterized protein n=1 Tax=Candidatus Lambdaproteobacteria bacterium RIFOXYD2_FULL_56_26 TaxID=1817773 RepID=A0A1F6GNB0_9PROT|nr:MAG: hypothetical protein A2557_09005 [Candidatus Lambdaproteobacteria bacterium RIFOXYD2_FULL_56_26]OGH05511.1 MAG: hypothetical protein A2426_03945 [Candidatus Lambdaproteobacteria bacterium RIFOXYC1_FULL_56_13]OGH09714.1 MAG: hypothetical protein A2600_07510 [Candidatus Lambdaproteobacteria bacterium RIFOXYD1_FULL_56_27]
MVYLPQFSLNQAPLGRFPLVCLRQKTGNGSPLSCDQPQAVESEEHLLASTPLGSNKLGCLPLGFWQASSQRRSGIWQYRQRMPLAPESGLLSLVGKSFLFKVRFDGSLFLTLQSAGKVWRVSTETLDGGNHLWRGRITSLSPIRIEARPQGGFVKLSWGQMGFSPDCFVDAQGQVMAPPPRISATAHWGMRDDLEALSLAFEGEAVLRERREDELIYEVLEKDWQVNALEEGMREGETFLVTQVEPQTLGILRVFTAAAHPFVVGDEVFLQPKEGATPFPYLGKAEVLAIDGTGHLWFEVAKEYSNYSWTFGSVSAKLCVRPFAVGQIEHLPLQRTGFGPGTDNLFYRPNFAGVLGTDWRIYEDAVEIGTGWQTDSPGALFVERVYGATTAVEGQVTACGLAADPGAHQSPFATVGDFFGWAAARLGLSLRCPGGAATSLDFVVTEQIRLIDLMDQVAGYAGYLFYVKAAELVLFHKDEPQGTLYNLSPMKVVDLQYRFDLPVREYKSLWSQLKATKEAGFSVIREEKQQLLVPGSQTQGVSQTCRPFNRNAGQIRSQLKATKARQEKVWVQLSSPLDRIPVLGEQFTYTDLELNPPQTLSGRIESLELDFSQDLLVIGARAETWT